MSVIEHLKQYIRPRIKIFIVLIAVLLIFFVYSTEQILNITESPDFCGKNCHIMRPYYISWLSSNHSSVKCVDCHYEPGIIGHVKGKITGLMQFINYETGNEQYVSLRAEVSDENCLGCHPGKTLPNVTFQGRNYSHQVHLFKPIRGITLSCTSCHSMIVIGMTAHIYAVSDVTCTSCHPTLAAQVIQHTVVTTSTCFTCHFRNLSVAGNVSISGCPSCHGAPRDIINYNGLNYNHTPHLQANISCTTCHENITTGANDIVPIDKCFTCHNVPSRLNRYNDTVFIHDNHVTNHKIACYYCHSTVQHMPTVNASICDDCHKNQHPPDWIQIHGQAVPTQNCAACHAPNFCANCHARLTSIPQPILGNVTK
jgi:hypothetical protein